MTNRPYSPADFLANYLAFFTILTNKTLRNLPNLDSLIGSVLKPPDPPYR